MTDRKLQSLKPGNKRYDVMDVDVRGFGVRVTEKGQRTFILIARYPGSTNPTRRALGEYPTLSLEKARVKARRWRDLIAEGKDPRDEEEKARRLEQRKRADSFEAVVEEYAKRVLPNQRRGHIVARELRTFFVEPWRGRPITSIERQDVIEVITARPRYQAHNLFGHVRSLFNWAIELGTYGLEHSPCDRIRPNRLIGERKPRQRVLDDAELRAFWRAAEGLGYPYGALFQLLLLTGCRKSEMGAARWREIDMGKRLLTIPAERFKSGSQHLVPLTDEALAILETLPRFAKGDHLFSATFGETPVSGFGGAKERLDELMVAELDGELTPFRTHDLRRTVRTRLAALKVSDLVAEMIIGHGKRGLQRVNDQHQYEAEMRSALELWATRLRSTVTPPPENVVGLGDYLRELG
ncbi:MAG: tyrosine-type recombinase/integrase [Methyloceanibacter sp.]